MLSIPQLEEILEKVNEKKKRAFAEAGWEFKPSDALSSADVRLVLDAYIGCRYTKVED